MEEAIIEFVWQVGWFPNNFAGTTKREREIVGIIVGGLRADSRELGEGAKAEEEAEAAVHSTW